MAPSSPPSGGRFGPARQAISIGETIDVEIMPAAPGALRLEARTGAGVLLGVLPVRVTEADSARRPKLEP